MRALRWSSIALVAVSWVSAAIFGVYILAFYGGAARAGAMEAWNSTLPHLYEPTAMAAAVAIGLHFAGGGTLLLLGPLQLIAPLRRRYPALHRWIGRLYATAATLTGAGGTAFILLAGTIGGTPMNVGFAIYGILVMIAALQTFRYGYARDLERHRAWAIRLYALAIGSWLYRVDYGFWALIAQLAGHTNTFDGPFDYVMAFWFYVPNLVVAELAIRARLAPARRGLQLGAALALGGSALLIAAATVFFTRLAWGPGIVTGLTR